MQNPDVFTLINRVLTFFNALLLVLRNNSYIFATKQFVLLIMTGILPIKPTDSELEILSVLWQQGPSSVRQVNDEINRKKQVGYTTTLKFMQIMLEKGLLEREEKGRKHIYRTAVREVDTQKQLLDRFVETAFAGSAMQLVMQALGKHRTTPEELDELKRLIEKIEKEQK